MFNIVNRQDVAHTSLSASAIFFFLFHIILFSLLYLFIHVMRANVLLVSFLSLCFLSVQFFSSRSSDSFLCFFVSTVHQTLVAIVFVCDETLKLIFNPILLRSTAQFIGESWDNVVCFARFLTASFRSPTSLSVAAWPFTGFF